MYAKDFEYDGQSLSDYNCIVCDFDGSSGAIFASAGSIITFNDYFWEFVLYFS